MISIKLREERSQPKLITHEVSVEEMTRLFLEISNDILSDLVFDKDTVTMKNHLDTTAGVLEALMKSDINAIRQLFKDGYTMQLVSGAISESFTERDPSEQHEIRVYDNETLLGVIINSEIQY